MLTPHGRSATLVLVAVGAVLAGMAALTVTLGLADLVRVSGPAVGDIVAFDANSGIPADLPSRLNVVRQDGTPCQLDLRVMQSVHGSLVIDGAAEDFIPSFRLHWAGSHSSLGGTDCGATADIVASDRVVAALLVATGGVGLGRSKQALPLYLIAHTPKPLE